VTSGEPEAAPDELVETRVVSDAAALKALADPLRLRLLEVMSLDPSRSWTAKELAAQLEQPVTKLYHHIKLLVAVDLVRDVESRVVSGIVEHRYRCAQRAIKLDDRLFGAPANRDASIATVAGMVDEAQRDFVTYLRRPDADVEHISIGRALARLTDDERRELMQRLEAIIDDIGARREAVDRTGLPRSAVMVLLHPMPDD